MGTNEVNHSVELQNKLLFSTYLAFAEDTGDKDISIINI